MATGAAACFVLLAHVDDRFMVADIAIHTSRIEDAFDHQQSLLLR